MMRVGLAREQRFRPYMEDRAVTGAVAGGFLVAVFDGHGGSAVAEHAARHVVPAVEAGLARGLAGDALWPAVFARLDLARPVCGSTATLLVVGDRALSAAWVGDSRAILVTEGAWQVLTPDHRIGRADERRRVLAAGAELEPPYVMDPASGQGLMVTRTLGDRVLRRVGVLAEPEVVTVARASDQVGLVLATDGLWDVVAEDEAAAVARETDPQRAAERLVELVVVRDGADNVTVVVGRFAPAA